MKKNIKALTWRERDKISRDHALKSIPVWQSKIEKTQAQISRLQGRLTQEISTLLSFAAMSGGRA